MTDLRQFAWIARCLKICQLPYCSQYTLSLTPLNFVQVYFNGAKRCTVYYSCINSFVPNTPFLYSLKTSENQVFWCFQGVQKGCIGNKRVNTRILGGTSFGTNKIHVNKIKRMLIKRQSCSQHFALQINWPVSIWWKICRLKNYVMTLLLKGGFGYNTDIMTLMNHTFHLNKYFTHFTPISKNVPSLKIWELLGENFNIIPAQAPKK